MKHRAKLLWTAIGMIVLYAFASRVLTPITGWQFLFVSYELWPYVCVAGALFLAWLVLEVTHALLQRRPAQCACGYSLAGVKCPECGKVQ